MNKRDWWIVVNTVCVVFLLPPPVVILWLAKKLTARYGSKEHKKERWT
jgi:hypothetical protein